MASYTQREWNIMHYAMSGGHIKCIEVILEAAGAFGQTLLEQKDAFGFVPYRLAKQKRYVELILWMENKGLAGDLK